MVNPAVVAAGITAVGGILGNRGGGGSNSPYGYSYSGGSSFGQSGSSDQSSNFSSSVQNPDTVWGGQAGYLTDLYSKAQAQSGAGGQNLQATQNMIGQGYGGIEQLLNPQVNPMLGVYQEQLQRGMEQNILPAIRREAIGFGQSGGSRQGVAEGLAAQEAGRMSRDFAAQVYGQDMDRMLGATQAIPGLSQAGLGAPWYGLNQYAGILGNPTVLGGGGSSLSVGDASGSSFGLQGSENFGEDFSSPGRNDIFGPVGSGSNPVQGPNGQPPVQPPAAQPPVQGFTGFDNRRGGFQR